MIRTANYRTTIAMGSGKEGEDFLRLCNRLAEQLGLKNLKGEPNYSALFRVAIEHLQKDIDSMPDLPSDPKERENG